MKEILEPCDGIYCTFNDYRFTSKTHDTFDKNYDTLLYLKKMSQSENMILYATFNDLIFSSICYLFIDYTQYDICIFMWECL